MRLFFALAIPPDIVTRVEAVQQQLRELIGDDGIRWTRPDQFHYTLKFLGEQSFERAETAVQFADAIAQETTSFTFTLEGLGAFPNAGRPSTLWLGASQGAEELAHLAGRIDEVLSRRGFAQERKAVKAHLTLARIKTYTGEMSAARLLREPPPASCGTFEADRFVLMRSVLRPSGSDYTVLREFQLRKRET